MLGKKIENLECLRQKGFPVPAFLVVDRDTDLHTLQIPWELCAVRSSASVEDGGDHSFAGQFDTYLNVPAEEVPARIQQCFASLKNRGIREYAAHQGISVADMEMHVIVQQMVQAEYSGVCFTANPQGLLNEMVIVAGRGTGDNVVEDKTDTTSYYYNVTDRVYYYEGKEDYLSAAMVEKLVRLVSDIQPVLGTFLDVEFAIVGEEIFLLQARDITTLSGKDPLILDNSNIVESYPGISLPLTCSFVDRVYSGIFRSISRRVLKNEKELAKYDSVFSNMVGAVNGRLYYKISNWYTVIKFLPMNHKIIPVWQDMLGVKIRSYDKDAVRLPKLVRAKTYFNVISEMLRVPGNMKKLNEDFVRVSDSFYGRYHKKITAKELVALFRELEDTLLSVWDVTLLNDIYAFLFTGLFKKRLGEGSNQVISGISNIESLKPIKAMVRLAHDKQSLTKEQYEERFLSYIREYGDRNLEELKLESETFRSNPGLLEERIAQYQEDPEKLAQICEQLQKEAPAAPKLKGMNRFLAKEAARGIANREISRLNRSRIFGMVRLIFTRLGEIFAEEGLIEEPRDIFWLAMEEAFALAENHPAAKTPSGDRGDLRDVIAHRKEAYELYAALPAYQRLIFDGKEFDKKHKSVNAHKFFRNQKKLLGTPCSDGIVEGEALVVTDVTGVKDHQDKILVTKMTDPGWVFLLVCAKGVISEKGSLLSHTAIISRELKIPSVVGVEGLLDTVRTGDLVRMNGNTGEIEIIRR
ncbi:MAG: phosphoenolpyruvate synthase [Lachnospiraceae bacterium]|nr:phosphoenolpyruvate synthase [Lachnospiraceae bacterium]